MYIYVRSNEYWDKYDAIKLGKTTNPAEREQTYITSEIIRGKYLLVVHVDIDVESELKAHFAERNIKISGGTEFYHKSIVDEIIPYLELAGYAHRKVDYSPHIARIYTPRNYQLEIVESVCKYFEKHTRGILVLPCGAGKTVISLMVAASMCARRIIIGVPSILLVDQWRAAANNFGLSPTITTYASAHKYVADEEYDLKINDECHHLTGVFDENAKQYIQMLNIRASKQLSLTATLREGDAMISNSSIDYFGNIIERRDLLWAINENIVCDYIIQTIISQSKLEKDKHIYLGAVAAVKSINGGHSHHILAYLNSVDNSMKFVQYVREMSDIYCSGYHSGDPVDILNRFNDADRGIISCVYCLGEGYDNPIIDGVVFVESMSSNIRIVQAALRASRKDKTRPNKLAKIILPINDDDVTGLKNIRDIVYQMGLEDVNVTQKIRIIKTNSMDEYNPRKYDYGEYSEDFVNSLRINTISRIGLTYETTKRILLPMKLKSRKEYNAVNDSRLPKDPVATFGSHFVSWTDYLGLPRVYYELEICRKLVAEYLSGRKLTVNICMNMCAADEKFPPADMWVDYYGVRNLSDLVGNRVKSKI